MPEAQPLSRKEIEERLGGDPLLADFLAIPKRFDRGKGGIAGTVERMANLFGKAGRAALIRVTISDGKDARSWNLLMSTEGCKLSDGHYERPDLEILIDEETFSSIAAAKLSPLEAFGRGRLRVRGDIALARRVARKLQGQ
jgi:putative sterol carrier protein